MRGRGVSDAIDDGGEGCAGGAGCGRRGGRGAGVGRGSLLEPAILAALATETAHGYDLRTSVEDLTRGLLVVDPGGLYRALRRMEDDGLVVSAWTDGEHGPQRRTYRLTADGREVLGFWLGRLEDRKRALDGIIQAISRLDATSNEENDDVPR
jgi:DNA-binding PadR family transcriptional regulator